MSLSLPIFDGGAIRARVGEARQNEVQARIRSRADRAHGVSQDVRNAGANLRGARARLDNATRQVALAEEVYRIAQVRQAAGAGTYVETVDAQTTLTTARQNYVRARYDVLTAYSQLQRAVGSRPPSQRREPRNDRSPTVKTRSIALAALLVAGGGCVNREAQKQARDTAAVINDPLTQVVAQPADPEGPSRRRRR